MSSINSSLKQPLQPAFDPTANPAESPSVQTLVQTLHLQKHVEGGYFVETDRAVARVPNPFLTISPPTSPANHPTYTVGAKDTTRAASTTIFYLVTPGSPQGAFHRNKGRTVHTLHWGRGRYVLIHADEVLGYGENAVPTGKAKVETFVVGKNVQQGERLQWIVDGGKYKASYLLPDEEGGTSSEGLLISETVVPGFEFEDHDFLTQERFDQLLTPSQTKELQWLVRKS